MLEVECQTFGVSESPQQAALEREGQSGKVRQTEARIAAKGRGFSRAAQAVNFEGALAREARELISRFNQRLPILFLRARQFCRVT